MPSRDFSKGDELICLLDELLAKMEADRKRIDRLTKKAIEMTKAKKSGKVKA